MMTERTFGARKGIAVNRVIFHVDVNSAFLSWEAAYRLYHLGAKLDLRTVPSAVGGDKEKRHGIILAKSIPSKKYGIQTGEPVVDAVRKCPDLLLVPPNYTLYNKSSRALLRLLESYSDKIEQYSIDEAFMDMTGCTEDPKRTAAELKDRIRDELGFTVNVGISSNKLLAKMASDFKKPDRVHTLWPEEIQEKMWPLPVSDLYYVGHASNRKLQNLGIRTIGELAMTDPAVLKAHMKSHGLVIWQFANGMDTGKVITSPPAAKGYGNSLTTPRDVCDAETAKLFLLSLAETVSARLRADGAKISVVAVSIRDFNLEFSSGQMTLATPTDLTLEIQDAACRCFDRLWNRLPIRHLGIHTSHVTMEDFRQASLFETVDYEKQKRIEMAVDAVRKRYGQDSVMRACFLQSPADKDRMYIDHMGGGISRERRTVDYSKEQIL